MAAVSGPRLARLVVLAELKRAHAQGRLAEIERSIAAHRAAAEALRDERPEAGDLAALRSGEAWRLWRDEKIRSHTTAAARLAAEREERRTAAARASGRFEVLKRLAGRSA